MDAGAMPSGVGIQSTFTVRGEVVHRFQSEPKSSEDKLSGSVGTPDDLEQESQTHAGGANVVPQVDDKFDHR